MKRLILILASFVVGLTGCLKQYVVRDVTVYQAELNQYDSWATSQAALLRGFLASSCVCDATRTFETKECRDSADYVLTIEARAGWHKAMSLFNAGITTERPPEKPPEIPLSRSLCPVVPLIQRDAPTTPVGGV